MSYQFFKSSNTKNILFIFNNLARIKDIDQLSNDDIIFLKNSNERLQNYLENTISNDVLLDYSVEPINYIEIINNYLQNEKSTVNIIEYTTELLNNFNENLIEKNLHFLLYISKEKNSLIPLWN